MRDGNLAVPCSRYGQDTADCVEAAYLVALILALEDGRKTLDVSELEYAMGLVVNDLGVVADQLRTYFSSRYTVVWTPAA